ncbi:MAG: Holliday junction branch migration protein RuvA [Phototrophicales bacterium]|nr:MAG: Holliday junction branch migration protein RuvA [Phototrophicales bacterium]
MIDVVIGKVIESSSDALVVLIGNSIGLRINVTRAARQQVTSDNHVTLFTYLAVREDDLSLYGFADADERNLFRMITSVSGIGPKLGMTILSTLNRDQLRRAIATEHAEILTQVPGIGKKTAQKIVFELRDKIKATVLETVSPVSDVDADVLATLTALGYSIVEAQTALQSIPPDTPQDVEERLRLALAYFAQ